MAPGQLKDQNLTSTTCVEGTYLPLYFCHLSFGILEEMFQDEMACINQRLQANTPNIGWFAQVVVSPYKVHAAQLVL